MAIFFYHEETYSIKFAPIIRMITDLGDENKIFGSMDTGVEQRATGPHRVDFMELFHNGEYIEMPTLGIPPNQEPIMRIKKIDKNI